MIELLARHIRLSRRRFSLFWGDKKSDAAENKGFEIHPAELEPADSPHAARALRASLRSGSRRQSRGLPWLPPITTARNTPGRTRTCNPRFRSLKRDYFASPEETTKSTFRRYRSYRSGTSERTSDFTQVASVAAQRAENGTDLRIPRIQSRLPKTHPNRSQPGPWNPTHQAGSVTSTSVPLGRISNLGNMSWPGSPPAFRPPRRVRRCQNVDQLFRGHGSRLR